MKYYLYILECSNGAYYTGYTTDIERRYREHCEGSAKCKYTRSFPPKRIAACWEIEGELSDLLKLEKSIKKLRPKTKQLLCDEKVLLSALFQLRSDLKTNRLSTLSGL